MQLLSLEILETDPKTESICREYWQLDESGVFVSKVNDIATKHGLVSIDILPLVNRYSTATSTTIQCKKCSIPCVFGRRAHVKCATAYFGDDWLCPACKPETQETERVHGNVKFIPKRAINKSATASSPRPSGNLKLYLSQVLHHLELRYLKKSENEVLDFGPLVGNINITAAQRWTNDIELGLDVGLRMAIDSRIPILIISTAFSAERIAARILCSEARIDYNRMNAGQFESCHFMAIARIIGSLSQSPITIIGYQELSPDTDHNSLITTWRRSGYCLPETMDCSQRP